MTKDLLNMAADTTDIPPPPRRKNRRWIWFFAVLTALSVVAVTIIVVYSYSQQLTTDQLAAAQALWQEKGPKSYKTTYIKNIAGQPSERIFVRVEDGLVDLVTNNDS